MVSRRLLRFDDFGVLNIRQLDAKPAGFAGPWRNYARMQFLRSGKNQSGPSLDQALLTPQAWWQASRPNSDWETFEYFGREDWAEYLEWYAKVTQADVEYETTASEIVPKDEYVAIKTLDSKGIQSCTYARQVVLATGREGLANPGYQMHFKLYGEILGFVIHLNFLIFLQ